MLPDDFGHTPPFESETVGPLLVRMVVSSFERDSASLSCTDYSYLLRAAKVPEELDAATSDLMECLLWW